MTATQMDLLDLLADMRPQPRKRPRSRPVTAPEIDCVWKPSPGRVQPTDTMLRREVNPNGLIAWRHLSNAGELLLIFRRPEQPLDEADVPMDWCPDSKLCRNAGTVTVLTTIGPNIGTPAWPPTCGFCGLPSNPEVTP